MTQVKSNINCERIARIGKKPAELIPGPRSHNNYLFDIFTRYEGSRLSVRQNEIPSCVPLT